MAQGGSIHDQDKGGQKRGVVKLVVFCVLSGLGNGWRTVNRYGDRLQNIGAFAYVGHSVRAQRKRRDRVRQVHYLLSS